MRTRSSSNLVGESSPNPTTSNPKRRNRRRSKQPFNLEEPLENQAPPVVTMADQRTMAELLRAPTEGYAEAIMVPPILAEHFELKHSLINMMTSDQFFGLEKDNPHDHIRWFNKITSTIKYKDVPNSAIKLMLFPFSLAGAACRWLEKEPPQSFHEAWDRYKDLLRACPHHGFTELHQLDTFYNALNPTDQDSLNSAAGRAIFFFGKNDVNSSSSSEIVKLTHAVNQQTSAVTTAMTAILKQFQATPPPASVKAVEEICVTCGGAHPYYQCLAADGNTFLEYQDNIQGYVSAATVNYNQVITTRSGLVLDGPSIPMPPPFINSEEDERVEETLTDPELAEYTIKVPPPLVQKAKLTSLKNYMVHKRDPLHPNVPYHSRMHQEKQQENDEMLKSLLSNKEKLLELANTPLNENCSAVILKKLPEKLGDRGKFLIPCGFSELKYKALADLGASINLMPLSVWKKLGLPELISTRMTLELANRAICTPAGIARDIFVPVRKFTFLADFVIVDYESDPRVPLILGRPFLRTARALIDIHGEEMILCDGDERLILNMRHDTSSYYNKPKKESITMIDIYNVSHEAYLEDLFAKEKATNHQSGNSTFSSHTDLTSPKVINPLSGKPTPISEPVTKSSSSPIITSFEESDLIWEEFEAYLASDSFPPGNDDPVDLLLEEFTDELALITFPPGNDDLPFDIESDLREIEYLLNNDPTKEMDSILEDSVDEGNLADPNNNLVDTIPEMFTDEHTLDYSSPPLYDDVDDDLVELESDNDDVYDDPFDSKEDKIKESKLLIDELDPPRSSDFLPSPKCDSVFYEYFSEVDTLTSTDNEDKVVNPGILIHENLFINIRVTPDKNVKKTTNASLILEYFNPPLYELPFHKEVPGSETLLFFSSENEEKVFKPGIPTSKVSYFEAWSLIPY
ncbi:reverse transcriptase domain-containing protein [Tanacetum coccineum]|uniref:Reverse transcriptase domain-containing protein n=1 Tax=Tanacetum coccineum TaxID=301880 RepID=A0ABQ5A0D2_9ASTR